MIRRKFQRPEETKYDNTVKLIILLVGLRSWEHQQKNVKVDLCMFVGLKIMILKNILILIMKFKYGEKMMELYSQKI